MFAEAFPESYRNGWIAHRNGASFHINPYDEVTQTISHAYWTTGWCNRFVAVKHGTHSKEMDNEVEFRE